jgi:hypothetical protein
VWATVVLGNEKGSVGGNYSIVAGVGVRRCSFHSYVCANLDGVFACREQANAPDLRLINMFLICTKHASAPFENGASGLPDKGSRKRRRLVASVKGRLPDSVPQEFVEIEHKRETFSVVPDTSESAPLEIKADQSHLRSLCIVISAELTAIEPKKNKKGTGPDMPDGYLC